MITITDTVFGGFVATGQYCLVKTKHLNNLVTLLSHLLQWKVLVSVKESISFVAALHISLHCLLLIHLLVAFTASGLQLKNVMSIGGCYQQNS
jgi:hypothetical protein